MTMIEWIRQSEDPVQFARTGMLAIHPCVVDTNVIMNDIVRRTRSQQATALMTAAQIGSLRLFAADHVYAEVVRRLPQRAARARVSLDDALRHWREDYAPLIRFVNVSGLIPDDPRCHYVSARDNDDHPTAALVSLLAPVLSLSQDKDLTAAQLATADWLQIALGGRRVAQADTMLATASFGAHVVFAMASTGARAARAHPVAAVTAVLGIGLLVIAGLRILPMNADTTDLRITARRALEVLGEGLEGTRLARGQLIESQIAVASDTTEVRHLCRLLAVAPRPVTATELARGMAPSAQGQRARVHALRATLQAFPAFAQVGAWRWQLGQNHTGDCRFADMVDTSDPVRLHMITPHPAPPQSGRS